MRRTQCCLCDCSSQKGLRVLNEDHLLTKTQENGVCYTVGNRPVVVKIPNVNNLPLRSSSLSWYCCLACYNVIHLPEKFERRLVINTAQFSCSICTHLGFHHSRHFWKKSLRMVGVKSNISRQRNQTGILQFHRIRLSLVFFRISVTTMAMISQHLKVPRKCQHNLRHAKRNNILGSRSMLLFRKWRRNQKRIPIIGANE